MTTEEIIVSIVRVLGALPVLKYALFGSIFIPNCFAAIASINKECLKNSTSKVLEITQINPTII